MGNSELEESACHPLLLSPKKYFTRLIVLKIEMSCRLHAWGCESNLKSSPSRILDSKGATVCEESFEFLCSLQKNGGEDVCVPRTPTSARRKGQVLCAVSNGGGRL